MRPVSAALLAVALAVALAVLAPAANAVVHVGDVGPNFQKTQLGGGSRSLDSWPDRVIVLFLYGAACPYCINAGPLIEQDWVYWQQQYPGEVQVVGVDLWDYSAAGNETFRSQTGISFPLLLNGGQELGGNFYSLYGTYDNYIILNKQRIVRHHAYDLHPTLGQRYVRSELRATVDSLVAPAVGVDDDLPSAAVALAAQPNPFTGATTIELRLPSAAGGHARVAVHDVAGRRVATLWDGPAPAGVTRLTWDGAGVSGAAMAAGVYVLRAEFADLVVTRRLVRLP
jgi:hypothetical protein